MSKKCSSCDKIVYTTEELKCLDKTWHKSCFRCQKCDMTLTMKNYKGYDKLPYCNAHYPTTKHTQVAITPELERISQNTKHQSQVRYHEEFEKMKGTKTSVIDDPETLRLKQVTANASQVEYMGHKTKQSDMEMRRGLVDKAGNMTHTQLRPPGGPGGEDVNSPYSGKNTSNSVVYNSHGKVEPEQPRTRAAVGSINDYDPINMKYGSITGTHQQSQAKQPPPANDFSGNGVDDRHSRPERSESPDDFHSAYGSLSPPDSPRGCPPRSNPLPRRNAPLNSPRDLFFGLPPRSPKPSPSLLRKTLISEAEHGFHRDFSESPPPYQNGMSTLSLPSNASRGSPRGSGSRPGSATGHSYGTPEQRVDLAYLPPHYDETSAKYWEHFLLLPEPEDQQFGFAAPAPPAGRHNPAVYQAMYDYESKDHDEVGFVDGDLIIDPEPIDEGWMVGTVKRTQQRGMLPANYVKLL